jgi:antitoxin component of MazEF toxin-antitoxin module
MSYMRVKLLKHGNSLGFNIPAAQAHLAHLTPGQEFELSVLEDGTLTFRPLQRRRSRYSVDELLEGVPEDGLRYEDVPEPGLVGKEAEWL